MFLPIKNGRSENQKSFLCEKNHFPFYGQVKKMILGHIGKNGLKTHYQQNHCLFLQIKKTEIDFFHKKTIFNLMDLAEKYQLLLIVGFWPIFANLAQDHFFDLAIKQKVFFFHIKMTFDFLSCHFWWAESCGTLLTQTLFLIFVIRGCCGGI